MFNLTFGVCFIMLFYTGWVIGLKLQCENLSILQGAKHKVQYVPLIQIILLFDLLAQSIKKKEAKHLIKYILQPNKSIVVLSFYARNAKRSEFAHNSIRLVINNTKDYIENNGEMYLEEANKSNVLVKEAYDNQDNKSIISQNLEEKTDLALYDSVYFTMLADCMDYYVTIRNHITDYNDENIIMTLLICNRLINCIEDNHSSHYCAQNMTNNDKTKLMMISQELRHYIKGKHFNQYGISFLGVNSETDKLVEFPYSILLRSRYLPSSKHYERVKKEDILYKTLDIINQTIENKTNTYKQVEETIRQLKYRYYQSAGIVQMLLDYQMDLFDKDSLLVKTDITKRKDSNSIDCECWPIYVFLPQLSKENRSSQIECIAIQNEELYSDLFSTMKADINHLDIIMEQNSLSEIETIQEATITAQRLTTILSTLNFNHLNILTDQSVFSTLLCSSKSILNLLRKAAVENLDIQYDDEQVAKKEYNISNNTNIKFCTRKQGWMKNSKVDHILRECIGDEKRIDEISIIVHNHFVSRQSLESSYHILRNVSDSKISLIVEGDEANKL